MQSKSRIPVGPLSSHSSIHLLVDLDALPAIRVNQAMLADVAGEPTVYLHIEAEDHTASLDHTATFTVSGPDKAIRQLLDDCRAALDGLQPPSSEHAEESARCGS